jgi:hypothetical protein
MNNFEYLQRHHLSMTDGIMKFNPVPTLSTKEFDTIVVSLSWRLLCPRLPRPGEKVLVRPLADAYNDVPRDVSDWTLCRVVDVEEKWGVPLEAITERHEALRRSTYLHGWMYAPNYGPGEGPVA